MTERILLVHDDPELPTITKRQLERMGLFEVILAHSAIEALDILEREKMDVIICDYQMTEMDGIEFLRRLKQAGDERPFILVTGEGQDDIAAEAINLGAARHVQNGSELAEDIISAMDSMSLHGVPKTILKESEFRSYFDNNPLGIFLADEHGNYVDVNPAATRITGYGRDELLSMNMLDLILEEGRTASMERFGRLLETGSFQEEASFTTKYGERRWWWINAVKLSGNRFLAFTEDITERKEMENLLQLMRFSMDNSSVGLYWVSPEGHFLNANKGACEMLGYSREELLEMDIWGVDPCPEHAQNERENRWNLLRQGGGLNFRSVHRKKDGTQIDVDVSTRYLELNGVEYEFSFVLDITDRVVAERRVRENIKLYMDILNSMGDMVLIIDENGHFTEVNDAVVRILGFSRDELAGLTPSDIDLLADERLVRERMKKTFEGGELAFDSVHLTKDGRRVDTSVTTTPFEYRGKKSILCVMRDISGRKRMENDIILANEKLNMVGAITRHDILNQLTNLVGYIDLARDLGNENGYLKKAMDAASRIQRILELGKDYESLGTENPDWAALRDTINIGLDTVDPGETSIVVEVGDVEVFADPMFEKVFHNLVDNGIRHGKARNIIIKTGINGNSLEVIVEDDGKGVEEERKESIFGPESGFGLHFSRDLLSITDIDIWEEGEYGQGARFVISIPLERYR